MDGVNISSSNNGLGERIMIIGCGGSGKSTLAETLGRHLDLPIIHLDEYYWHPGWVKSDPQSWEIKVKELIEHDKWIMDGNYGGTMDLRIARAETIIFLQFPTRTCLSRVLRRSVKYYGRTRPNMPENCPERFSPEFYHYILMYNLTRTPKILYKLKQVESTKSVHILQNDQAVNQLLRSVF